MKILSMHSLGHDSGACYVEDGRLVYSVETERLTRWKHDHRVALAISDVLSQPGIDADAIDLVTVSSPVRNSVLQIDDFDRAMSVVSSGELHYRTSCRLLGRPVDCVVVTHEVSHAALALHYAGYPPDCLVLVNEGRGQISQNSLFRYSEGRLHWLERDPLPWYGSGLGWTGLGIVFGLGKSPSVAGKVMALGGYGEPSERLRGLFETIDNRVLVDRAYAGEVAVKFSAMPELKGGFEVKAGIVSTFQQMFTEAVVDLAVKHLGEPATADLALGGGCALNIVANSELRRRLGRDIAIPPACGDAGHPIGAAAYAQEFILGQRLAPFSVYCNGAEEDRETIRGTIMAAALNPVEYDPDVAVQVLADGGVVALARGRAESGPRALGNRSLLGNPAVSGMRIRLSERLKGREWFRPLGAVMRAESFAEWYPAEHPSPYMLFNYDLPDGRLPEARHVDGTCRLQTVAPGENPPLEQLLREFERACGVPALINTSLNGRGRAIAQRAHDVLMDFRESDVDLFVLGDLMARNRPAGSGGVQP